MPPFSLRIFVADGDPDGLRIVDRSNWNGKALVFPRAVWAQPTEPTLSEPDRAYMQVFLAPMLGMLPVLGCSANGRVEWKDAQGRALKLLQTE